MKSNKKNQTLKRFIMLLSNYYKRKPTKAERKIAAYFTEPMGRDN